MKRKFFYKAYVKILTWLGMAVDIPVTDQGPAGILSYSSECPFVFDGIECGGMQGFLQSLKHKDTERQERICSLYGAEAKRKGTWKWTETQTVYWKGKRIGRHSAEFQALIRRAFRDMAEQCPHFRETLAATGTRTIYHTKGRTNPRHTILTEKEFCEILTELRKEL